MEIGNTDGKSAPTIEQNRLFNFIDFPLGTQFKHDFLFALKENESILFSGHRS